MSARSLNKVILIGNLTRDPELRYTPSGTAVFTFGLATNRSWTTQTGEAKEDTEFHRIVAWNKLGELCSQLLTKGRKVYVEGRLATHSWTGQDGTQRTTTEIVIEDMIILDSKRPVVSGDEHPSAVATASLPAVENVPAVNTASTVVPAAIKPKKSDKKSDKEEKKETPVDENITPDDIPF
ncbi:single-stranded DNA-binding protein [Candidatus Microgenomates bacterium]|nr:single-stranded DNA-binding protein [Candidatus Microgenomates bacterium]